MKKFIFSFFLFSVMVVGAQAQHACCKPGGKSAAACEAKAPSVVSVENAAAAEKVAAMDQTIEKRTDPITGSVSYVRKETAVADGSVTFVSLNFDPITNSFVNVAPSAMEANHSGCAGKATGTGKSCCAGKAAAASAPKPEKTKS